MRAMAAAKQIVCGDDDETWLPVDDWANQH